MWTNYTIIAMDVGELTKACRAFGRIVEEKLRTAVVRRRPLRVRAVPARILATHIPCPRGPRRGESFLKPSRRTSKLTTRTSQAR